MIVMKDTDERGRMIGAPPTSINLENYNEDLTHVDDKNLDIIMVWNGRVQNLLDPTQTGALLYERKPQSKEGWQKVTRCNDTYPEFNYAIVMFKDDIGMYGFNFSDAWGNYSKDLWNNMGYSFEPATQSEILNDLALLATEKGWIETDVDKFYFNEDNTILWLDNCVVMADGIWNKPKEESKTDLTAEAMLKFNSGVDLTVNEFRLITNKASDQINC